MPGYRPPSTEPRGKWARAIHAKRRADGISQTAAFETLGPLLGFGPKSRAAYVAIDLGLREPTEAEQAVLVEWLGGYPADVTEPETGGTVTVPVAYLARLDALVSVVSDLLARVPVVPQQQAETTEARLRAVEAELESLRAQRGAGAPGARSAPVL